MAVCAVLSRVFDQAGTYNRCAAGVYSIVGDVRSYRVIAVRVGCAEAVAMACNALRIIERIGLWHIDTLTCVLSP